MEATASPDPLPQWILVAGDVLMGLVCYGPFESEAAALDAYADHECHVRCPAVVVRL